VAKPIWLATGILIPIGTGLVLSWFQLASRRIRVTVLFHEFLNWFFQDFSPTLTMTFDVGQMMLGEFGWFLAVFLRGPCTRLLASPGPSAEPAGKSESIGGAE
jgi:hypothetical protein